jgi:alanine racemase
MVMNPSDEVFPTVINYNLEPEIYSIGILDAYNNALKTEGMMRGSYKIHIKMDTGMNRLGFKEDQLDQLLNLLNKEPHFKVASVFSHLAASDNPEHDDFTRSQFQLFEKLTKKIETTLGHSFIKHISNTAAIERFPEAQNDMVRLGLGLYGVAQSFENQPQLHTVSALFSIVVQVKEVAKGESVGYNRSFVAKKDMKIAIIPIGYADGLDRKLGNGVGFVFVSGFKRPIIGNICMDIIMVDITGLSTKINDRVELFGANISVQEVARLAGSISYEILAGIPPRVKRVYIKEDS